MDVSELVKGGAAVASQGGVNQKLEQSQICFRISIWSCLERWPVAAYADVAFNAHGFTSSSTTDCQTPAAYTVHLDWLSSPSKTWN